MVGSMRSSVVLVVTAVLVVAARSLAMLPPQCSPEMLDEIDNPKIHEICRFLQTYADAVEQQYTKGKVKKQFRKI
jgi:hemerythrin-like domain-containing protein